jgi:hypothetical protein
LGFDSFSSSALSFILLVEALELLAPAISESWALIGAHQGPFSVSLDSLHEEVRHPQSIEKISSAHLLLTVIFPELKEVIDVDMPRLKIHSEGSLSLTATLVDEASSVIEHLKHGYEAISISVGAANVAVNTADI